jgi:hypothetical protein
MIRNTVRSFRQKLLQAVRHRQLSMKICGSRGQWTLVVKRGKNLFYIRGNFMTQATAIMYGFRKTGMKASRDTTLKVAA